jgi:hypothetical protein
MGRITLNTLYNWEAAYLLFLGGAEHNRIAEMLSIPHGVLRQYSAKHSWCERRTRALKEAKLSITRDLSERIEKAKYQHQKFMLENLEQTEAKIDAAPAAIRPDDGEISVERKLGLMDKQDVIARRVLGLDKDKSDPIQAGFAMLASISQAAAESVKTQTTLEDMARVKVVEESHDSRDENTPETPSPLPPQRDASSDPLEGILGPFNGPINGPISEEKEDKMPIPDTIKFD